MRNAVILRVGLVALLSARAWGAPEKAAYKVIVNAANPETSLSTERLSTLFLKNVKKWTNGMPVFPVDQSTTTPVRIAFSKDVFDQPVVAIQSYWEDQIAHGREGPPPVRGSDREVIAYVEANVGAVGYVSPETILSPQTKAMKVTR